MSQPIVCRLSKCKMLWLEDDYFFSKPFRCCPTNNTAFRSSLWLSNWQYPPVAIDNYIFVFIHVWNGFTWDIRILTVSQYHTAYFHRTLSNANELFKRASATWDETTSLSLSSSLTLDWIIFKEDSKLDSLCINRNGSGIVSPLVVDHM